MALWLSGTGQFLGSLVHCGAALDSDQEGPERGEAGQREKRVSRWEIHRVRRSAPPAAQAGLGKGPFQLLGTKFML